MIITTTPNIEGKKIVKYLGIVTGEVIEGADFISDFEASLKDLFGGRATSYEETFIKTREEAISEMTDRAQKMGANAIVGADLDYEVLGDKGTILLVSVSGTAVITEEL